MKARKELCYLKYAHSLVPKHWGKLLKITASVSSGFLNKFPNSINIMVIKRFKKKMHAIFFIKCLEKNRWFNKCEILFMLQ